MPQEHFSLCARCHHLGRGCCQLSDPAGTDQMFGLTRGEVAAIARASGQGPAEFLVADDVAWHFRRLLERTNPVLVKAFTGGVRWRLRVDGAGVCHFLGPGGCLLPVEARPLYCRMYPFMVTAEDRLMVLSSPGCLAQEKAQSWREVMRRMGMTEDQVRGLYARMEELAADHEAAGGQLLP